MAAGSRPGAAEREPSSTARLRRRRWAGRGAEEDADEAPAVLVLSHFSRPPFLCFGSLRVGASRTRLLGIDNPNAEDAEVLVDRFPASARGFSIGHRRFSVQVPGAGRCADAAKLGVTGTGGGCARVRDVPGTLSRALRARALGGCGARGEGGRASPRLSRSRLGRRESPAGGGRSSPVGSVTRQWGTSRGARPRSTGPEAAGASDAAPRCRRCPWALWERLAVRLQGEVLEIETARWDQSVSRNAVLKTETEE